MARTKSPVDGVFEMLAASLVKLRKDLEESPATAERLLQLTTGAERTRFVQELLAALVPDEVDHQQWMEWFEGGAPPARALDAHRPDPDPDPEHAAQRVRSVRGEYLKAVTKRDAAAREVSIAQEKLASLEARLAEAEQGVEQAKRWLQTGVSWLLMREISRQTAGIFAMGPAWSLMRIVSGYIQADPEFERGDGIDAKRLAERKRVRPSQSLQILDALDRFCGDERFELNLHNAIYSAVMDHRRRVSEGHLPLAKSRHIRRRSDDQQSRVHPAARTDDVRDVLDGFSSPPSASGRTGRRTGKIVPE